MVTNFDRSVRFDWIDNHLELANIGLDSNKGHILMELITFAFQEQENLDPVYAVWQHSIH